MALGIELVSKKEVQMVKATFDVSFTFVDGVLQDGQQMLSVRDLYEVVAKSEKGEDDEDLN